MMIEKYHTLFATLLVLFSIVTHATTPSELELGTISKWCELAYQNQTIGSCFYSAMECHIQCLHQGIPNELMLVVDGSYSTPPHDCHALVRVRMRDGTYRYFSWGKVFRDINDVIRICRFRVSKAYEVHYKNLAEYLLDCSGHKLPTGSLPPMGARAISLGSKLDDSGPLLKGPSCGPTWGQRGKTFVNVAGSCLIPMAVDCGVPIVCGTIDEYIYTTDAQGFEEGITIFCGERIFDLEHEDHVIVGDSNSNGLPNCIEYCCESILNVGVAIHNLCLPWIPCGSEWEYLDCGFRNEGEEEVAQEENREASLEEEVPCDDDPIRPLIPTMTYYKDGFLQTYLLPSCDDPKLMELLSKAPEGSGFTDTEWVDRYKGRLDRWADYCRRHKEWEEACTEASQ